MTLEEAFQHVNNNADRLIELTKDHTSPSGKHELMFVLAYELGLQGLTILEILASSPVDRTDLDELQFLYLVIGQGMGQKNVNDYGFTEDNNTTKH